MSRGRAAALVVDDDEATRRYLGAVLSHDGMTVDEASDGASALERVKTRAYDLVLLDLALGPGPQGLDVLSELRRQPGSERVAVVVVTGSGAEPSMLAEGLSIGADDYVPKHAHPVELRARIGGARRRVEKMRVLDAERALLAERAVKSEGALAAAARAQRATRPTFPVRAGDLQASGCVLASEAVSGDTIDVVTGPDGVVTAFLVDVAGHGTAAAMVGSGLGAVLREAGARGASIGECVEIGERFLAAHRGEQVAAVAAVGIVRVVGDVVELANLGLPPLALASASDVRLVPSTRPPLGMGRPGVVSTTALPFPAHAVVVLASDGALDHQCDADAVRDFVTRARVGVFGDALARATARELETLLVESLGLARGTAPGDDASVLFLGRGASSQNLRPATSERPSARVEGVPPTNAAQAYRDGRRALADGLLPLARRLFRDAHAAQRSAPEPALAAQFADWLLAIGDTERAELDRSLRATVLAVLREDVRCAFAHYVQGRLAYAAEDSHTAARAFAAATRLDPGDRELARWARHLGVAGAKENR